MTTCEVDRAELTNLDRLQALIDQSGLDVVLATSLENVTYLSGLYDLNMRTLTDRMYIVVWSAEGHPTFITPGYRAQAGLLIEDVRGYDYYARDQVLKDSRGRSLVDRSPMPLLAEVLGEKGLATGRIGLEKMHFPVARYEELSALLPSAEFVDCSSLFDEARMVKTAAEIDLLQAAGIATERAIHSSFELARPGDTTRSLADAISSALLKLGADRVAFLELEVMSDGKRLGYLEEPSVLKEGDLLRVDAGGFFCGYYSDVARMAVVGEPNAEQRSTYQKLFGIQRKVIDEIMKPDRSGRELLQLANRAFEEFGLKPHPRSIAHGLGLFIHERPWLREAETYELRPGMVLCVEIIKAGQDPDEMWQLEDLIVVTDEGTRELTTYSATDQLYIMQ
jgi:Xaa-Pro aminopeptidase